MRPVILFALLAAGVSPGALQAATEGCPDAPTEFATVSEVGPDLALVLTDGRIVVSPALESPRATAMQPARPQGVQARLRRELVGTTVGLALLGARNRWGATPAVIFTQEGTFAETLLARGDVRFRPDPAARACRVALLAAERQARDAGAGVWSDDALRPVNAAEIRDLTTDGLTLVEGTVMSVGETQGRLYLNLGKARGGFAISMPKRDIALMQNESVRKARVVGTRLRVRGLVDRGSGLRIDVFDADALEILAPEDQPKRR